MEGEKAVVASMALLTMFLLAACIQNQPSPKRQEPATSATWANDSHPPQNDQNPLAPAQVAVKTDPKTACVFACRDAMAKGIDLSQGPCLLDPIPNSTYVCDVAHTPRQAVDDEAANQCSAFRDGRAHHFVEVAPDCALIRAY